MTNENEPNTIVGSIRQINAMVEEIARHIHTRDIKKIETNFLELRRKVNFLGETFPKIKQDRHFQELVHAVQEFEKEKGSEDRTKNPNEFWPKLEQYAAKILAASQKIHGEKPSPFGFIGRLFR